MNISAYEEQQKNLRKEVDPDDSDFPNKKRNTVVAVLFATLAMVGYALSTGIIKVLKTIIYGFRVR